MLAKITSKNQITIPKRIMDQIRDTRYFEIAGDPSDDMFLR